MGEHYHGRISRRYLITVLQPCDGSLDSVTVAEHSRLYVFPAVLVSKTVMETVMLVVACGVVGAGSVHGWKWWSGW